MKAPYGYYDGSGNDLTGSDVHDDHLRIHHYTYRDENFMRGEKSNRVRAWGYDPEKTIYLQNDEYNIVEDTSILRILYNLNRLKN